MSSQPAQEPLNGVRDPSVFARPFPLRSFTVGLVAMVALIVTASTFNFLAMAKLDRLDWSHARAAHDQVFWYLWVGTLIRAMAIGLVLLGALLVRRGALRMNAAREAAEEYVLRLKSQQVELNRANRELSKQARTDPLTGLATRLSLAEDLEAIWSNAERHGDHYCAVMCDVDRFKEFNDTYGHVAGDEVLRRIAQSLGHGRVGDRVYRYGGEEFLLLLRVWSLKDGLLVADRQRTAIEHLRIPHCRNEPGVVTVSMGLAPLWAGRFNTAAEWIQMADAALYRAKRSGRNCMASVDDETAFADAA